MKAVVASVWLAAALIVGAVASGCGGDGKQGASPAPVAIANPVDPATAGSISGLVRLDGTPPPAEPINRRSDPYCEGLGAASTQVFVTGSGGTLQNVFVYIKDGLGNLTFPVPQTPVVLDQKGCSYAPRVLGIQAGQPLQIVNSDATLHNIHARPEVNREFNRGQALQGMKDTHVFSTREVMVPFKCDVHNWMTAWIGVLDHPFYSVTGGEGTFSLQGLPPGTYTVEAWHEKLGVQTQTVTVGSTETKEIAFTFKI